MKKTRSSESTDHGDDGLRPEYKFDYSKARRNRFADRYQPDTHAVVLDPDVARVFTTPESVNAVLRALIETMPGKAS